ncbi:MAG: hypothetical protein ABEJ73_04775, partial [Haloplanus sp.]
GMLVAFDSDGTLVKSNPFVKLGEQRGASGEITGVLDRVSNSDITFEAGLHAVAEHLEGLQVAGDAGHEAACHWLGRSEAERAAHTPTGEEREVIERSSRDSA